VVVLVEEVVVGAGFVVVVESSGSVAATLQADNTKPSATNLAIVVRIVTSVRTGTRLTGITR
jgi:hypothetical protein